MVWDAVGEHAIEIDAEISPEATTANGDAAGRKVAIVTVEPDTEPPFLVLIARRGFQGYTVYVTHSSGSGANGVDG
jgi:hypothetical protein